MTDSLLDRINNLLAGVCGGRHLAATRLQLGLGLAELLLGGRCAVDFLEDGLLGLCRDVRNLPLRVAAMLECSALHADGLVAAVAVELERLSRVDLAARGRSGRDWGGRGRCGRPE